MTATTLSAAIAAVQQHHPHWHVYRTDPAVWSLRIVARREGSGTVLDAPTPERLDQELYAFEHKHGWAA